MKAINFKLLLVSLLIIIPSIYSIQISSSEVQQQQGTHVIFYIQHQIQQRQDYVQISIQIKSQQQSLQLAINQAKQTVTKVESIVNNYCLSNVKNKKQCQKQDIIQISQYQIDPIYQLVRKVPTFVVSYQITAKIKEFKNIGKLADDLLKSGVSKINSFQWKPLQQIDVQEQAVTKGMQLVNSICDKMNMELGRIIQVSEVSEYEQENQEDDKKDEEEQDEQQKKQQQEEDQDQQKVTYKFQITCQKKKPSQEKVKSQKKAKSS